jgi:hypothetical protein
VSLNNNYIRKAIITFLFTVFISHIHAQLIVANDKMNIVYAGVENPINFSLNGYDFRKLILTASCGTLSKKDNYLIWKLCGANQCRYVKFSCYLKTKQKAKRLLATTDFRIHYPPDPIFIVTSGHHDPGKKILGNYGPLAQSINFEFDINFQVKSYDLEFIKQNGDTLLIKNSSRAYTKEAIQEIKKLQAGDLIHFKNIIVFNDCEMIERKLKDDKYYYWAKQDLEAWRSFR